MLRDRPLANKKHQCWSIKKILDLKSCARITECTGFFAHRRIPMGKKINILCVLRVSVVKYYGTITNKKA
jgi:hypothetical protein